MLKQYLSIFFTVLFLATTVAPSVIVFVNDTIDVSFIIDASEEEEKGNEKNKEFEVFVVDFHVDSNVLVASENEDNLKYTYKKYPKPHLNLISPPPEFIS